MARIALKILAKHDVSVPVDAAGDHAVQWVLRRVASNGYVSVDNRAFSVGNAFKGELLDVFVDETTIQVWTRRFRLHGGSARRVDGPRPILDPMAAETGDRVLCGECDTALDERSDIPAEERTPCPDCGSSRRVFEASATFHGKLSFSADAVLVRAWDGASLTLFGILYAIIVTVAGVVVAMVGTTGPWWWWVGYAVVSLGLLALALLVFPQAAIVSMRWLVERAKKAPRRWR